MTFKPSKYQQAIYDWVETGSGSAIVEAVAGSGKTTTALGCLSRIDARSNNVIYLAFNRSIADELRSRVPAGVSAATFHSVGMKAWRGFISRPGGLRVDGQKIKRIIEDTLGPRSSKRYGAVVPKLVGLAKAHGLVPSEVAEEWAPCGLMEDDYTNWMELVDHYAIELSHRENEDNGASWPEAIECCRKVLAASIKAAGRVIDFDDMLYQPVVAGAGMSGYDWVFVDEAQDVSPIQLAMLQKIAGPGSRLMAVGDPHQAIYGFRGADHEALENIGEAFGCRTFPLSISYRCPRLVVEEAQQYVSHIESSPTAPDGEVSMLPHWDAQVFDSSDAILCRNQAPLVETAFRLIGSGVACRMMGRDFGKGLVSLVEKLNAQDVDHLELRLEAWETREREKAVTKGREDRAQSIADKAACVRTFIDNLPEGQRSIRDLIGAINDLFADQRGDMVTLSTVHKSKGLEFETVYLLDRAELMPSPWARREWQQRQETNLIYVAVTRSMGRLIDISSETYVARSGS